MSPSALCRASRLRIWTRRCSSKRIMTPAGLEPAIPGSVGRCLIHWATGPVRSNEFGVPKGHVEALERGSYRPALAIGELRRCACGSPRPLPVCDISRAGQLARRAARAATSIAHGGIGSSCDQLPRSKDSQSSAPTWCVIGAPECSLRSPWPPIVFWCG